MGLLTRFSKYYQSKGLMKTIQRSSYETLTYTDVPWAILSCYFPGSTNKHEIRVVAQRRSGHHAVVNWLRHQIKGRYCFLNNCDVNGNPFVRCQRESSLFNTSLIEHSWAFWERESSGCLSKKGVLIYNYEDKSLSDVVTEDFERHRMQWLGTSDKQSDILILRDPFNLMASRFRWILGCGFEFEMEQFKEILGMWKEHAREFLGETSYFPAKVAISYNEWFCNQDYRQEISRKLGLEWNDKGLYEVAKWGPTIAMGSFNGLDYDGQANKMKVLERWKEFDDHPDYLHLLNDEEIFDLSSKIFGLVPGTEVILDK